MMENQVAERDSTPPNPAARVDAEKATLEQATHEVKIFVSKLHQIEENGNVELICSLFHENAELWRQSVDESYRGLAGTRRFWKEYLDQFTAIHSRFSSITERQGLAVLEWESEGLLRSGRPIHYRGVSILDLDEAHKIRSFKTYFDSAHFLQATPLEPHSSQAESTPPRESLS